MNFVSDNAAGAAPEIMQAVVAANEGVAASYGSDAWSSRARSLLEDIFEHDLAVALVASGSAANGLALATLAPPYGAIFAHEASHVHMDECGAPEFFTGGAKLIPLRTGGEKITRDALEQALARYPEDAAESIHRVRPSVLSLTQPTEYGVTYELAELRSICELARESGLAVHVDGARFANALVTLGCSPAEATWKQGVDALSLGLTKNGAMAADVVVLFDAARSQELGWRCKRAGQLLSKSRFTGAQLEAALTDGLWLRLAARANKAARRLAEGLSGVEGIEIAAPVNANAVFAVFPERVERRLLDAGAAFLEWDYPGDRWGGRLRRLMTSHATSDEEVERLIAEAAGAAVSATAVTD
jgi:threonine aldolase